MTLAESTTSFTRARKLLVLLAFIAFISLGLPDGVLGVAWPFIRQEFQRALDNLGVLLFAGMTGYLLSSFFAGQVMRFTGVGALLAASCACVTVALMGYTFAPGWWWLVPVAFVGGLGGGAIDSGLNTYAARHFSTRVMNWLHACWGIGATTGPIIMTGVLSAHASWRVGYGVLAVILGILTMLFVITRTQWNDGGPASAETHTTAPVGHAIRHPMVWLHVLIYFVYGGIESSAGQLLFTLFTEARQLSVQTAGAATAAYWAALTVGRFSFGQLAASASERTVLLIGTLLAPLGAVLIWWHPHAIVGIAGAVLLGFALAPIFPTYISITPARVGEGIAPHAVGFQVAACAVGIMVFPGAVARLSLWYGLSMIPIYLVAATMALLLLHLLAQKTAR